MALTHFPSLPVMTARLHTVAPGTLLPAPQAKSIAAPPAMARMKCQATQEAQMGVGGSGHGATGTMGGLGRLADSSLYRFWFPVASRGWGLWESQLHNHTRLQSRRSRGGSLNATTCPLFPLAFMQTQCAHGETESKHSKQEC